MMNKKMKKIIFLIILLTILASIVNASDISYLVVRPDISIPDKLYDVENNMGGVYPFTYNYEIDKEKYKENYLLYKDKNSSLLLVIDSSEDEYYSDDDYYSNFVVIIYSSKYVIAKSKPFQKKFEVIDNALTKMNFITFLKKDEYITFYNLTKNNGNKNKIEKLEKINLNRFNTYKKLLKEGSKYSCEIAKRQKLFGNHTEPNYYSSKTYLEKLDEAFLSTQSENNKKANNILYKIIELENIMRASVAENNTLSKAEYNNYISFVNKNRPEMDKAIMNAIIKVTNERKEKLAPNQEEKNHDITKEVISILDKGY